MKYRRNVSSYLAGIIIFFILTFQHALSISNELIVPVEHFPPWIIVEQEEVTGINIELIKEVARRAGLTLTFKICPWKRCLKMMETGEGDLMTSLLKRPEREAYMYYVEPPYKTKSTKTFYVKKGNGETIRSYEDLYALQIGVVRGTKYFEPFDSDPKLNKDGVASDVQNLRKLENGRLDGLIGTESNIDYLIFKQGLQGKFDKTTFRWDRKLDVYMAISKKSPYARQLQAFNDIVSDLVAEGYVNQIIESFYKPAKK